jgi:hypothetical protein
MRRTVIAAFACLSPALAHAEGYTRRLKHVPGGVHFRRRPLRLPDAYASAGSPRKYGSTAPLSFLASFGARRRICPARPDRDRFGGSCRPG